MFSFRGGLLTPHILLTFTVTLKAEFPDLLNFTEHTKKQNFPIYFFLLPAEKAA